MLAAEKYEKPELVNLGSGEEISIRDLLELICSLAGYEGSVLWDASKPDGQPRRCLDMSRRRRIRMAGKYCLRDGLRNTIAWLEEEVSKKSHTSAV